MTIQKSTPLSKCIGIQIEQLSQGIFIHQQAYATKILQRFQMEDCNPRSTPLEVISEKENIYRPKDANEDILSPTFVENITDILTKTLPPIKYIELRNLMNMVRLLSLPP